MNIKRFFLIEYILLFSITLYSQEKDKNMIYDNHDNKLLHEIFTERDNSNHFNEYHPSILNNVAKLTSQTLVDSAISESTSGRKVKKTFPHNDMGKIAVELEEEFDGSKWVSNRRTNYTYNDEGNKILSETENFIVSQWFNVSSTVSNFDLEGNEILQVNKLWVGSDWENSSRNTILYDSDGNFIELLVEVWTKTDNNWEERNKFFVEKDSSGTLIEFYEVLNGGYLFYNNYKYTVTFNSDNQEVSRLYEVLQDNNWIKKSIDSTFYDSESNVSLVLIHLWDGSNWIKGMRKSYNYSQNGNLIFISEIWNNTDWIPGNSSLTFEDEHGNRIGMYGSKITIYFSTITDVNTDDRIINNFELSQNYPNPFNPTTTITYSLPKVSTQGHESVKVNVFDVLGRKVKSLVNNQKAPGKYEVTFDASDLPSGIYYYTLQTSNFNSTKKMVLLK